MLEVDLATQFSPRNQQVFADAQESCSQCVETIQDMSPVGTKLVCAPTSPRQQCSTDSIQVFASEKQQSNEGLERIHVPSVAEKAEDCGAKYAFENNIADTSSAEFTNPLACDF